MVLNLPTWSSYGMDFNELHLEPGALFQPPASPGKTPGPPGHMGVVYYVSPPGSIPEGLAM